MCYFFCFSLKITVGPEKINQEGGELINYLKFQIFENFKTSS